jgi:hypothetical protein
MMEGGKQQQETKKDEKTSANYIDARPGHDNLRRYAMFLVSHLGAIDRGFTPLRRSLPTSRLELSRFAADAFACC